MSQIFVCRECGYVFPQELSHLIESNIQVYCERCGSPFILEGVKFKPAPTPYIREKKSYHTLPERKTSSLDNLIQFLNKISSIPLFIFTCVSFGLIAEIAIHWDTGIFLDRISHGLLGLFLLIYDRTRITRKVKEKNYNDIFLDAFCWGILGSILYGIGVIILIKGIFIIISVLTDSKNKDFKIYDMGLLAKNSLNYFSTKAGLIIVLFGMYKIYSDGIYLPNGGGIIIDLPFGIQIPVGLLIYIGFLLITLAVLLIDGRLKKEIMEKQKFVGKDSAKFIVLGIFGSAFYAAGVFVLLKGILIFFLCLGKPSEKIHKISTEEKPVPYIHPYKDVDYPRSSPEDKEMEIIPKEEPIETTEEEIIYKTEKIEETQKEELEEIPLKIDKEDKVKREEEFKLKLHESLLPVKDEKDKKLVKEYFSKIFAVLSKDLRKQIIDLKISKKEKKELLEELAFLTKEEQVKYIEAIIDLYKDIPKKLINKIRKLPNVKPKHYDKIVEQLKYMDYDEQLKFVQFLEENA